MVEKERTWLSQKLGEVVYGLENWLRRRGIENRFCQEIEDFFAKVGFPAEASFLIPQEELKGLEGPSQLDWARKDGLVEISLARPKKDHYHLVVEGPQRSVEFEYWRIPHKHVAVILKGVEPLVNPVLQKELRLQYLIFGIKVLEIIKREREELARAKRELVI